MEGKSCLTALSVEPTYQKTQSSVRPAERLLDPQSGFPTKNTKNARNAMHAILLSMGFQSSVRGDFSVG